MKKLIALLIGISMISTASAHGFRGGHGEYRHGPRHEMRYDRHYHPRHHRAPPPPPRHAHYHDRHHSNVVAGAIIAGGLVAASAILLAD